MRILTIRGKNLASLQGEFEVDFTKEPLASAGIFAITGSTGSGKSTILDAICLALYDETPRINRAADNAKIIDVGTNLINQRDCRSILRRGTADGYAEIEFISLSGERYRSRWSVRRAREKANGAIQSSTFSIFNATTGEELQGTKTELLRQIVELVGLSFDQFTRAVLLAQGDFATFLKAPQKEKAELLEKLTGTDIYSRISKQIFERTKTAEQEHTRLKDKIKDVELLDDVQIKELTEEKETLSNQDSSLDIEIKTLTAKLQWIERDETLSTELAQAETDLLQIQDALKSAKPRFDQLALIESIQEIRDEYRLLQNDNESLITNQATFEEQKKEIESKTDELKKVNERVTTLEKEKNHIILIASTLEPQIREARALDIKIQEVGHRLTQAGKALSGIEQQSKDCKEYIATILEQISTQKDTLSTIETWFKKHHLYKTIIPRVEFITSYINDIRHFTKQIVDTYQSLESTEHLIESNHALLELAQKEMLRLNKILPAEIALLRSQLVAGEACMVCGSTHHPITHNADEESLAEQALNESKAIQEAEINRLTEIISNYKEQTTQFKAIISQHKERHKTTFAKLSEALKDLPHWEEQFNNETLIKLLQTIANDWANNIVCQSNIEIELRGSSQELISSKKRFEELEQEKKKASVIYNEINAHLLKLKEERTKLFEGQSADVIEKEYNFKKLSNDNALNNANNDLNHINAQIKQLTGAISQLKSANETLKANIKTHSVIIEQWLNKRDDQLSYNQLAELLIKDTLWIAAERTFCDNLNKRNITTSSTLSERKRVRMEHQENANKPTEEESKESLKLSLQQKNLLRLNATKRIAEIGILFTNHEKGKQRIKEFENKLNKITLETDNWRKLNELFGSADGAKFKVIAQGYTLDILLSYANKHLETISQRYLLERVSVDSLSLQVIDLDMLSEIRSVHTLSGGESFLISLSLALGLSSLSSNKMNIESLFIDEGFGSLDADTLRVAMDALERLQTQGRKIGVISHVAEMTERITTQIQVIKSNNGKSHINIV